MDQEQRLLEQKNAVIYGGGGAVGGAVARSFARAGARVFLAGRTPAHLDKVAGAIVAEGGRVEIARVDALDELSVERHADEVVAKAGRIDIVLNAMGVIHVQGTPLAELGLEEYAYPVTVYTRTNFITAKAAAHYMVKQRSGVIFTLSTPVSQMPGPGFLGHSVACAGVEALTRHLAGELGSSGIRVICLRSHAIPEALALGSHSLDVFRHVAARADVRALGQRTDETRRAGSVDALLANTAASTLLKRLPTLADLANTATFLASEKSRAMTGAIVNLTCGSVLD